MRNFIVYILFVSFFFLFYPLFSNAFAATLKLDPTTITTATGKTFDMKVNVSAGVDQIKSADAWVIYDPKVLEPTLVTDGTFFITVNKDLSTSGKAYISGMVDDPTKPVTGTGTIATITFKALTDGTDSLTFDCTTGSTNGSFVIKADAKDTNIIECSGNGTSAITAGTGVNTTPTVAVVPSDYPTPSSLPKSGVFDNVVKFAVPGMILFLIGTGMRILL